MSLYQNLTKIYDVPDAQSQNDSVNQVPRSCLPPRVGRPFMARKQIRQIQAVSGATAGPSQTSIIKIPTGNGAGFMVAGSAYLNFRFAVTQASATWGFAGSLGDASALINRLTLSQSVILEQIQNYGLFSTNVVSPYATSANYSNISQVCAGGMGSNNLLSLGYNTGLTTTAVTTLENVNFVYNQGTLNFSIPLLFGLFSGGSECNYLPLALMSQNLDIQTDWATVNQAFSAITAEVTNYSITQLSVVYETVQLPMEYENAVRAKLLAGSLYSIPFQTCISSQVAGSSALSYNFSVNCSSVSGFCYGTIISANQATTLSNKNFSASASSTNATDSTTVSRRQLYADGDSVQQFPVYNMDSMLLKESARMFANCNDPQYSVPFSTQGNVGAGGVAGIRGSFRSSFYLVCFNLRNFSESSLCLCGRPVGLLNLQINDSGASSTDTVYMFAIVDYVAVLDGASGSLSLIR